MRVPRSLAQPRRRAGAPVAALLIAVAAWLATMSPTTSAAAAVPRDLSGSVVFIRQNNVWIARPDGTRARALTRNGTARSPYAWPSEDDHGHVVAIRGESFVRLDQHGRVLQHFAAPVPGLDLGLNFASVSPDGTKIAFSWTTTLLRDGTTYYREVMAYSAATRSSRIGRGAGQNIVWATWVNNRRTVAGGVDNTVYYKDVATAARTWYTDCDATGNCAGQDGLLYNNFFPAVNRQGTVYASAIVDTGYDHTAPWPTLFNLLDTRYFGAGTPPKAPTRRCSFTMTVPTAADRPGPRDSSLQSISFSPRGSSLVFAARSAIGSWGVYRVDGVSDLSSCRFNTWRILGNARQPRWSAAPLT